MEYQSRDFNKKVNVSIEVDYKSIESMTNEIWRGVSYRKLKISNLIAQGYPETDYRISKMRNINEVALIWHEQLQTVLSKYNKQF